jgi:hypothetical protein
MDHHDKRFEYTRNDYLADQVDHLSDRVKFHGTYADDPARMAVLLNAGRYDDVISLEDWHFETELYPEVSLEADRLTRFDNPDIPVRAYYLARALERLLDLVEAPEAMISDLKRLLWGFEPKGAQKYSDAQRALIENPGLSITAISKLSGLDRSTVHALLKRGILVKPD